MTSGGARNFSMERLCSPQPHSQGIRYDCSYVAAAIIAKTMEMWLCSPMEGSNFFSVAAVGTVYFPGKILKCRVMQMPFPAIWGWNFSLLMPFCRKNEWKWQHNPNFQSLNSLKFSSIFRDKCKNFPNGGLALSDKGCRPPKPPFGATTGLDSIWSEPQVTRLKLGRTRLGSWLIFLTTRYNTGLCTHRII